MMKRSLIPLLVTAALAAGGPLHATATAAAGSLNAFGLDLHRRLSASGGNLVTSPWSIETALAMTYAGADGATKAEMARVLHFPADETRVHEGFAALTADLRALAEQSAARAASERRFGGSATPLQIKVANRLFGQDGYPFEPAFLALVDKNYGAPLQLMDFRIAPDRERQKINHWVEQQTRERIKELIAPRVIDPDTRLVLVNAVFLKASWAEPFADEPKAPFFVDGRTRIEAPGLVREADLGYARLPGGAIVTVPYADRGIQFVLFVPDARDGLAPMEASLTPEALAGAAKAPLRPLRLHFPSFKLQGGSVRLAENLIAMGMASAFDKPEGSADFSRLAPRKPDDYLFISEVVHQAFVAVDKYGTEAAAATAVVMPRATAAPVDPPQPLEVRVDRPFAFAIQHTDTGACLFLGRVTDPR
jgi:serpin B